VIRFQTITYEHPVLGVRHFGVWGEEESLLGCLCVPSGMGWGKDVFFSVFWQRVTGAITDQRF
jgi:hypothetical protein